MDADILLAAGGIFLLRVIGNIITTLRLVTIMHGNRPWTFILGVLESLIFAVAIGTVVSNLDDLWNLAAYCVGYAVGGYLGMVLEQRLVQRYVSVQVISASSAHAIAEAIRGAGFGATEHWGQGARSEVGSVTAVVGHRDANRVMRLAHAIDADAFVTMEELRSIARGFFRVARPEQR